MLFRKKYDFQINQNKDTLTQVLKGLTGKPQISRNDIGIESSYSVEFSWDEFIITSEAKMFEKSNFSPDAHMKLSSLSENMTQVDIKIKLSEIWWIFLVFIHLGIIAGSLFADIRLFGNTVEANWLYRILILLFSSGLLNFIVWLIFVTESKTLKKIITQLFEHT